MTFFLRLKKFSLICFLIKSALRNWYVEGRRTESNFSISTQWICDYCFKNSVFVLNCVFESPLMLSWRAIVSLCGGNFEASSFLSFILRVSPGSAGWGCLHVGPEKPNVKVCLCLCPLLFWGISKGTDVSFLFTVFSLSPQVTRNEPVNCEILSEQRLKPFLFEEKFFMFDSKLRF